jgi:RNA polymerase sigma-70 factor, ECF subfamily
MLKIVLGKNSNGMATLSLEGRVIGPWVEELGRACEPILASGRGLTLDLSSVSFLSREGVVLLRELRDRQVALLHCSAFVAEQLKADPVDAGRHGAHTDWALVERLRAHDTAALETLMERHSSRVYRVAFGITRNHPEAEEVVQDVFLTLFRKIDMFEGRAALGTWLYRVAANAALIKRRGKRVAMEVSLEDCLPTFRDDGHREGDRAMLVADWSPTPESELLSGEAREILDRALERLPEHYRALLVLRDVEELSNEKVAEILGESVSSVKSRLHRARMALREILTRQLGHAYQVSHGG